MSTKKKSEYRPRILLDPTNSDDALIQGFINIKGHKPLLKPIIKSLLLHLAKRGTLASSFDEAMRGIFVNEFPVPEVQGATSESGHFSPARPLEPPKAPKFSKRKKSGGFERSNAGSKQVSGWNKKDDWSTEDTVDILDQIWDEGFPPDL